MVSLRTQKVNKVGGKSLCVVIPYGWAKANKIRPGDEVEVVTTDNGMSVRLRNNITESGERTTSTSGGGGGP